MASKVTTMQIKACSQYIYVYILVFLVCLDLSIQNTIKQNIRSQLLQFNPSNEEILFKKDQYKSY